jgi:hypothetical protein
MLRVFQKARGARAPRTKPRAAWRPDERVERAALVAGLTGLTGLAGVALVAAIAAAYKRQKETAGRLQDVLDTGKASAEEIANVRADLQALVEQQEELRKSETAEFEKKLAALRAGQNTEEAVLRVLRLIFPNSEKTNTIEELAEEAKGQVTLITDAIASLNRLDDTTLARTRRFSEATDPNKLGESLSVLEERSARHDESIREITKRLDDAVILVNAVTDVSNEEAEKREDDVRKANNELNYLRNLVDDLATQVKARAAEDRSADDEATQSLRAVNAAVDALRDAVTSKEDDNRASLAYATAQGLEVCMMHMEKRITELERRKDEPQQEDQIAGVLSMLRELDVKISGIGTSCAEANRTVDEKLEHSSRSTLSRATTVFKECKELAQHTKTQLSATQTSLTEAVQNLEAGLTKRAADEAERESRREKEMRDLRDAVDTLRASRESTAYQSGQLNADSTATGSIGHMPAIENARDNLQKELDESKNQIQTLAMSVQALEQQGEEVDALRNMVDGLQKHIAVEGTGDKPTAQMTDLQLQLNSLMRLVSVTRREFRLGPREGQTEREMSSNTAAAEMADRLFSRITRLVQSNPNPRTAPLSEGVPRQSQDGLNPGFGAPRALFDSLARAVPYVSPATQLAILELYERTRRAGFGRATKQKMYV